MGLTASLDNLEQKESIALPGKERRFLDLRAGCLVTKPTELSRVIYHDF